MWEAGLVVCWVAASASRQCPQAASLAAPCTLPGCTVPGAALRLGVRWGFRCEIQAQPRQSTCNMSPVANDRQTRSKHLAALRSPGLWLGEVGSRPPDRLLAINHGVVRFEKTGLVRLRLLEEEMRSIEKLSTLPAFPEPVEDLLLCSEGLAPHHVVENKVHNDGKVQPRKNRKPLSVTWATLTHLPGPLHVGLLDEVC